MGIIDNWWYINIGNIYFADKNYLEASNSYKKAITRFTENITDTIDAKTGIAVAYSNLALIYREQQDYDSAMILLKKSLSIREKLLDNNSTVFICNLITENYIITNDFIFAQEYINKAFFYDNKTDNHAFMPNIYLLQASLFVKQGKNDLALKKLNEASVVSINLKNKNTELKSYRQIIKLLKEQKNYVEAIQIVQKAIILTERIENSIFRAELFKEIANLYTETGNYDSAYKYLNFFVEVKDTLEQYKYSKLQNKYEFELNKAQLNTVNQKLKHANQKNTFYQYSIIAGIIILAVLIILLLTIRKGVVSLKVKNKRINNQKDIISAKNEEILQQNEEIKSVVSKLDEHKIELEDRIKEQTKDLRIAIENAIKADKLKTAFLENLSHEIRTPLNAIVGFANLLELEEGLSDSAKGFLNYINNGSEVLLKIIDSIMEVSRIQLGESKLSITPFNPLVLVNELSSEFKETAYFKNKSKLKLITKLENKVEIDIYSDLEALKTILFKLIDNAIKFTEEGYVEISCKQLNEQSNNFNPKELLFYVKDTGIGIEKDDINFVFDKFRKIDSDKSKLYRGLGLGLTIVKSLVEQLGGKIWLESEINKGSTFFFTISTKISD